MQIKPVEALNWFAAHFLHVHAYTGQGSLPVEDESQAAIFKLVQPEGL